MHSALKHDGKPLYEYARAGHRGRARAAPRAASHSIRVVEGSGDRWTIDVSCSKGTYVRTLAEDIGAALGCGAHLAALRRTASGALDLARGARCRARGARREPRSTRCCCRPMRSSPPGRAVILSDATRGGSSPACAAASTLDDAPSVRVYGPEPGAFLGTGHVAGGELIASRLLSPAEVGDLVAARAALSVSESLSA